MNPKIKQFFLENLLVLAGMVFLSMFTLYHTYEAYALVKGLPESIGERVFRFGMLASIEVSMIIFAIRRQQGAAWTFATLIFLVNLFALWYPESPPNTFLEVMPFLVTGVIAAILSFSLGYFADILSQWWDQIERKERNQDKLRKERDQWKERAQDLESGRNRKLEKTQPVATLPERPKRNRKSFSGKGTEKQRVISAYNDLAEQGINNPTRPQVATLAKVSVPTVRRYDPRNQ